VTACLPQAGALQRQKAISLDPDESGFRKSAKAALLNRLGMRIEAKAKLRFLLSQE
jgi:hypothetical protein